MEYYPFYAVPILIRDEILKKMSIVSFTRARMTCKAIFERTEKFRTKFPVQHRVDLLNMNYRRWHVINNRKGSSSGEARIRIRSKPIEMIGLRANAVDVTLSMEKHPAVFREFGKIFKRHPISCERLKVVFGQNSTIFSILNCFTGCQSVIIDSQGPYPYFADVLDHPVVQKARSICICLITPDFLKISTTAHTVRLLGQTTRTSSTLPAFFNKMLSTDYAFQKIELNFINGFSGKEEIDHLAEKIRRFVVLDEIWSRENHSSSKFQDVQMKSWGWELSLTYYCFKAYKKVVSVAVGQGTVIITQFADQNAYEEVVLKSISDPSYIPL